MSISPSAIKDEARRLIAAAFPDGYFADTYLMEIDLDAFDTDKKLRRGLRKYGENLADIIGEVKVPISEPVQELIDFIVGLNVDSEIFACKDPLGPGDMKFSDIAGQEEVKNQLKINYILPATYKRLFPAIGKGILFYGPPGTGKTALARAATAEIQGAAFFAPGPGELKGKYEGETEKNIAATFACAEQILDDGQYDFSIIFFDEFDSIAGKRGDDPGMTRSVNALLQAMDGIKTVSNVSVVGATNYPDSLDDAVLRRFDTRIFIDLPDPEAREYIIRSVLAEAYGDPNLSKTDRKKDIRNAAGKFNPNAIYLENIKKYGGAWNKQINVFGFTGTTTTLEPQQIDSELINQLVDGFGPTSAGLAIIKEVSTGVEVSEDDPRLKPAHIFGYSPSDISKVMNMAVKYAAADALDGMAYLCGLLKEKDCYNNYYIVISKELGARKGMRVKDVPEKDRVINFNIYKEHIMLAKSRFASTIDNQIYLKLLKYSKQ